MRVPKDIAENVLHAKLVTVDRERGDIYAEGMAENVLHPTLFVPEPCRLDCMACGLREAKIQGVPSYWIHSVQMHSKYG